MLKNTGPHRAAPQERPEIFTNSRTSTAKVLEFPA